MENKKYFNFPINLIKGFIDNTHNCIDDIFDYAIYSYTIKKNVSQEDAAHVYGVTIGNSNKSMNNGKLLYESTPVKMPFVGIEKSVWFDFYKNEKTDFQKVTLLAYLALRSILMDKPYCKVTNDYLFSRIDGNTKIVDASEWSDSIRMYYKDYQITKIKNELILFWNLKHYARYTRGFYISFNMKLEDLIFHVENNKKSKRLKQQKQEEKEARAKALERLNEIKK